MDNRYRPEYNYEYRPRGPPSYTESNPQVTPSYTDSIPRVPPSYTESIPQSYDKEKDFDENRSYQDDMNRYPAKDSRGDYSPHPDNARDRYDSRDNRPDNERYPYDDRPHYDDREPYDDRRSPYDDRRYNDDRYDDRRNDRYDDRRYDDRSDSYNDRPAHYDDNKPYDDSYHRESDSYRDDGYDDRPRNGRDYQPQYSDEHERDGRPDNGYDSRQDRDRNGNDPRYTVREENVELPPRVQKAKKKPILKELKPAALKAKWQKQPPREKKKYCALIVFLILSAIAIIVVPCAIYIRVWHKLTWQDILRLQIEPRDIKWGQQGRYVYYRDISDNIIRVDLTKQDAKVQEIILEFEIWKKVGYDDFDVTGPGTMIILAKNSDKASERHVSYVDLYKYEIGDTNNQPQMFKTDVVNWEVLSHETENRIVFVQLDSSGAYNIRLQEMGPSVKTLKNIGEPTDDPSYLRGVLCYLYSEEFFDRSSKGFWISTNGDYVVFMETDMSTVQQVTVAMPGNESQDVQYYYPMPGGSNPIVKLKLYYVTEDELVDADDPLDPNGKQNKDYITSVSFPNSKKLLVEFMNRQQTRAVTEECTMSMSPTCEDLIILRRDSYQSWLPRYSAVAFPASAEPTTQQYYVLRPRVDKQFNFTHLHKYETTNDPNKKIAITAGEFAVTDLIGNDHTRKHVLYVRTEEINTDKERTSVTRKRMLYLYNATDDSHTCISCMEPEDRCNVATASIDSSRQWYQMECLGRFMPYRRVKSFANNNWDLYSDENQNIQYENPSLQAQLMQKRWPMHEYTQTELDKNSKMYVAVKKIFPLYYVKHANVLKYPLVIWVNPYPDGNMATETYNLGLAQWLATNHNCVVMYVDVKGTPGRGLTFHHYPYKNFQEIVDKSKQAIKDIKMYWHVNDNKVAIMGEKLGGWLALKMAETEPDWFKAVIAVNPILDFNEYLSAYSERYLDLPTNNQIKYDAVAILNNTLGLSTNDIRERTAVYYDSSNYEVPNTFSSIIATENSTFKNVALYNITEITSNLSSSDVSDSLWSNIGLHITQFLEESPHDIFPAFF